MTNGESKTESAGQWIPPYISFRTMLDLLQRMSDEEPPARIDKTYLHSYSGGYQTQVIAALNSLGLRKAETGEVTDLLTDLVTGDETARKKLIAGILDSHYGPVRALDRNATQGQMLDAFKDMGVNSGDTMRKVVAFFLTAAKYAEIPVSKHWKTPAVPRSAKRRSSPGGGDGNGSADAAENKSGGGDGSQGTPTPSANLRSVTLRSGGTVTLGLTVDLFSLDDFDQKFVLDLVKKVREYGEQFQLPAAPSDSEVSDDEDGEDGSEEWSVTVTMDDTTDDAG